MPLTKLDATTALIVIEVSWFRNDDIRGLTRAFRGHQRR